MRVLLITILSVNCFLSSAQEGSDSVRLNLSGNDGQIQPLNYKLPDVTITAFHNPEKFRSVAGAVSIMSMDSLRLAGYNIVSSLAGSPGLNIQEATAGTMKLTLRGIGSRYPYGTKKIKMFFDGIPLYSAEGETYFDDISPEYLSRIEILRGPASSVYGASLGGAIVLYPDRPGTRLPELSLMSTVGSYGYLKNSLSFSDRTAKDDILVSYAGVHSDGYRENSNYRRNSMLVSVVHRFSGKLSGSLLLTGSVIKAQIPSSIDSATFVSDPQAAAPQWLKTKGGKSPQRILAGYKLNYNPSGKWNLIGSLFTTLRKNEENRPFNFLDESGMSYGGRFLASYAVTSGPVKYKFTAGSNIYLEIYNNSIFENPGGNGEKGSMQQKGRESIYQADIFSQAEILLSDFTFSAGFNLNKSGFNFTDQFSIDSIDQSGSLGFDPVFSPRLSVAWHPVKVLNTYVAVNHGFSIPSLSETMTPLGLINTAIKPEKAWSLETGARVEVMESRTFIDLALYYMRVTDLIVPKRVAEDFYVGMNAGASLHKGIEIAIQQWLAGKMGQGDKAPFSAVMNISTSFNSFRFLDFSDGENDFSGNQLPGIPEFLLNGSIDMKTRPGFIARLEILSSGRIPLDDFNSGYADAWTVMNGTAGYSFKAGRNWKFDAMVTVSNITDEHYASMVVVNAPGAPGRSPRYYYPGMPRWATFSAGVSYRFNNL